MSGEFGRPRGWDKQGGLALAVLFSLTLFATCLGTLWAWQTRPLRSRLPSGFVVQVCAGVVTAQHTQAGLWWLAPGMSAVPLSVFLPPASTRCGLSPWLPFLPQHGRLVFPP